MSDDVFFFHLGPEGHGDPRLTSYLTGGGDFKDELEKLMKLRAVTVASQPAPQAAHASSPGGATSVLGIDVPIGANTQPNDKTVKAVYQARIRYADRAGWGLAPEGMLFELIDSGQRSEVAKKLVLARAGLADHQLAEAEAQTDLTKETKVLLEQLVADRQAWRTLARFAPALLIATVAFSIAAIGYLLLDLANDSNFDDWTIPVIVFALALFAASPAVLLLTEKPLKGVDEWTPGGIAKGADPAPAAAETPAAPAPTNGSPSGAAGYTKGPGRPD